MPIQTALWKVGPQPQQLTESSLAREQLLEDMIVDNPSLLSDEWVLISRQEDNGYRDGVAPMLSLPILYRNTTHSALPATEQFGHMRLVFPALTLGIINP